MGSPEDAILISQAQETNTSCFHLRAEAKRLDLIEVESRIVVNRN